MVFCFLIKTFFRCHSIQINGRGDGDCSSKDSGGAWCYLIGEDSNCADKEISAYNKRLHKQNLHVYMKDVYHSYEACKNSLSLITLPDFLPGYELVGQDSPRELGGGGFYTPTPEACETECFTRRLDSCDAWTFLPGNMDKENKCYLKSGNICENITRKQRKNNRAISGYLCQLNHLGYECWSANGNFPRFCPYVSREFQAFGTPLRNLSGTVSLTCV